jgi:hypothetical protein
MDRSPPRLTCDFGSVPQPVMTCTERQRLRAF